MHTKTHLFINMNLRVFAYQNSFIYKYDMKVQTETNSFIIICKLIHQENPLPWNSERFFITCCVGGERGEVECFMGVERSSIKSISIHCPLSFGLLTKLNRAHLIYKLDFFCWKYFLILYLKAILIDVTQKRVEG